MIHVVNVGPTEHQPGGMAAVVGELLASNEERSDEVRLTVLDSGGIGASAPRRALAFIKCLLLLSFRPPDIVHLHVASRGSTWRKATLAFALSLRGTPYGVHLHGASYAEFLRSMSAFRRGIVHRFFRQGRYVVVLGNSWARFVAEELGVDPRKIHVIYNGVRELHNCSEFADVGPPDISRYVLFLGRIEQLKGVHDLLEAWRLIPDPDADLVIAGAASEARTVDEVVRLSGEAGSRIRYLGLIPRNEALSLLQNAWALVLPSYAEGLPMALIEAMSMRVPCISTAVGAIPELIDDGVDGVLLEPGDVTGLTNSLDRLLEADEWRNALAAAAYAKWRLKFDSARMYDALTQVWTSASIG